jgi:hypothetical protein
MSSSLSSQADSKQPSASPSHEALVAFLAALRGAKHDISNTFAVFLALAELAETNPEHLPRLAQLVRERCPKVIADLQSLQQAFASLLQDPGDPKIVSSSST